MSHTIEAFVHRVLDALPGLDAWYEAARGQGPAENDIDGIPVRFLGDYTSAVVEMLVADPVQGSGPLVDLARVLDGELGHDPLVDSVIDSQFMAALSWTAPPDPAQILGPRLAAALEERGDWRQTPENQSFVHRMVQSVPALDPLARENTLGEHGDVMVHEFLAGLVRREIAQARDGQWDEARTVLDLLEREWDGDIGEAIAVSFVENLPLPEDPAAGLVDLLGPHLRAEYDRQHPPSDASPEPQSR
jgi:hypothetical protein